jgi:ABC-type glycerol-3-phosphate transport system substrate-binding protein
MSKRVIIIILITAAVLLATVLIVVFGIRMEDEKAGEPKQINVYLHLYDEVQKSTLEKYIHEFEQFYPDYLVNPVIMPYQDMLKAAIYRNKQDTGDESAEFIPDLIVLAGADLDLFQDYIGSPRPWTGSIWRLYYHEPALRKAGLLPEEIEGMSWKNFFEKMKELKKQGDTPISLGGKFSWPWLAWLQHLSLASGSGSSPENLEAILPLWMEIENAGLVNSDYKDKSWPLSVSNMVEGKALFVLFDDAVYSPIDAEHRKDIGSVPFPGSLTVDTGIDPWQVGSLFYLAIPAGTGEKEGSQLLLDYLTNESVTGRFFGDTGLKLFSSEEIPEDINTVPSVAQSIRDPLFRPLIEWLNNQ